MQNARPSLPGGRGFAYRAIVSSNAQTNPRRRPPLERYWLLGAFEWDSLRPIPRGKPKQNARQCLPARAFKNWAEVRSLPALLLNQPLLCYCLFASTRRSISTSSPTAWVPSIIWFQVRPNSLRFSLVVASQPELMPPFPFGPLPRSSAFRTVTVW